jgi:hypothetical protein
MKQSKGEAAFESIDEVLAEKIVHTSKHRAQESSEKIAPHSPTRPEEAPSPDQSVPIEKKKGIRLLIGIGAGLMLLVIGIMCFNKCKEYCK